MADCGEILKIEDLEAHQTTLPLKLFILARILVVGAWHAAILGAFLAAAIYLLVSGNIKYLSWVGPFMVIACCFMKDSARTTL